MPHFGKNAWMGAALLALPLVVVVLLAETVLPASVGRLITLYLIYVIAVAGNGIYSGNSGIMSFGHSTATRPDTTRFGRQSPTPMPRRC